MQGREKPGRRKAKGAGVGGGAAAVGSSSARGRKNKGPATEQALEELTSFLDGYGAPAAIIGGIAVIAWGFGRSTLDIDAAVAVARRSPTPSAGPSGG